jgi:hypothetical protein
MFADHGVTFYIGMGPERVKFDKPWACEHSVHVSGMKAHAHTQRTCGFVPMHPERRTVWLR